MRCIGMRRASPLPISVARPLPGDQPVVGRLFLFDAHEFEDALLAARRGAKTISPDLT